MSGEKVGIVNVKMLVVGIASLGSVAASVLADGKIGLSDFTQIMKLTSTLGHISAIDVKAVLPEVADLDAEERNELMQVFDDNFNLGDHPTIEAKLEAGLAATMKAVEAVQFIISLTK